MFGQILFTQLRWTRPLVALMSVLAFLTPAIAWWMGAARVERSASPVAIIAGFDSAGPLLAGIALLGAFVLAAYPWSIDAQSKHVQALSLPIPWSSYVGMRFAAGALTLLVPTLALWLGSLLALSFITIPETLRAYPGSLALRFLAASLLAYAMTFAMQYLAGRRSTITVLGLFAVGGVLWFGIRMTGNQAIVEIVSQWLTDVPGPFAVFAAEWRLLDV